MSEVATHKWRCDYCTYLNWPKALKCTLCQAPRPVQLITPAVSSENVPALISPDNNAQRSSLIVRTNDAGSSPSASTWQCKSCTYLNWARSPRCTICKSPRLPGPLANENTRGRTPARSRTPQIVDNSQAINNDRNRVICQSAKKWTCTACTYENWPKAKKCVICMTGRGRLSPDTVSSAASPQLIAENIRNVDASASKSPPTSPPRSPASAIENATVGATSVHAQSHGTINVETDKNSKQHCRRLRKSDYLFLQACVGVVDNNPPAVETYISSGGNPTRQLTRDEVAILNRPSAFDVGLTLVHLAIRFKREDLLASMLSFEVTGHSVKRPPSQVCPDLSADIRKEIAISLRQRKGDFPCYFVTDILTFILPEIEFLPSVVRTQLFDELLDQDAQKELEQESQIINWSIEIGNTLGSRLFALWNRTAGDCLLDSALQATWGVFDTDGTLRRALGDSLNEGGERFYERWKAYESMQMESLQFSLDDDQWLQDWTLMLSLAGQPGAALEQTHIFALAHILRRPIIVYGVKFIKSFRGENLGYARFQGVYLPLLWEQSFCWKTPIALGYTRGHFSALVPMETESEDNLGAGANLNTSDDTQTVYLPLTDYEGKLLPVHFITPLEVGTEEKLLNDWLDCCYTPGGLLVAQQIHHKKRPVLIGQMVEEWLQRYRRIAQQL